MNIFFSLQNRISLAASTWESMCIFSSAKRQLSISTVAKRSIPVWRAFARKTWAERRFLCRTLPRIWRRAWIVASQASFRSISTKSSRCTSCPAIRPSSTLHLRQAPTDWSVQPSAAMILMTFRRHLQVSSSRWTVAYRREWCSPRLKRMNGNGSAAAKQSVLELNFMVQSICADKMQMEFNWLESRRMTRYRQR